MKVSDAMQHIAPADVQGIVRLLGQIAGMTEPLAERRRTLLSGLVRLVDGDLWLWIISQGMNQHQPGPLFTTQGGFLSEEEAGRIWRASIDPESVQILMEFISMSSFNTALISSASNVPGMRDAHAKTLGRHGIEHGFMSFYPLGDGRASCIGIHRRTGRPPFTPREHAIVHLVVGQIDWLHRSGTDSAGANYMPDQLSLRLRETLLHLLAGDGRKQIARKMGISEHTVGDYLKALHKHFNVASRSELLAKFVGNPIP